MPSFLKDLQSGQKGEQRLIDILTECGIEANAVGRKQPLWDLECVLGKNQFTVEVKNDLYEAKSGNVAIEVHNCKSDKPSGLTRTKADLWCHILSEDVWIIKTDDLRSFVEKTKPLRKIKSGGDGNATLLLYPTTQIMAVFTKVSGITPKKVSKIITGMICP